MGNSGSTALKDYGDNSYAYRYLKSNLYDSTPIRFYTTTANMSSGMNMVSVGAALGTAFHESIGIDNMYMGTVAGALIGCAYMMLVEKSTSKPPMECLKEGIAAAATVYVVEMVAGNNLGQAKMFVGPAAAYFGSMLV